MKSQQLRLSNTLGRWQHWKSGAEKCHCGRGRGDRRQVSQEGPTTLSSRLPESTLRRHFSRNSALVSGKTTSGDGGRTTTTTTTTAALHQSSVSFSPLCWPFFFFWLLIFSFLLLLFTMTAPVVDVLFGASAGAAAAVVVWSLVVGIRSVECMCSHHHHRRRACNCLACNCFESNKCSANLMTTTTSTTTLDSCVLLLQRLENQLPLGCCCRCCCRISSGTRCKDDRVSEDQSEASELRPA